MKVQCDVCENAEASVMCCADEAALCAECDGRIHTANKLASKHPRLTLLYPQRTSEQRTCCDVCQDKAGFFFCLEDRALLCRTCDFSIHSTNALTAKHKRFLVPGIQVSLEASLHVIDSAKNAQGCMLSQICSSQAKPSALSSSGPPASPPMNHISSSAGAYSLESYKVAPQASQGSQQSVQSDSQIHISRQKTGKCGTYSAAPVQSRQLQQITMAAAYGQHEVMVASPSDQVSVPLNPFNYQVELDSSWEMHPRKVSTLMDKKSLESSPALQRGDEFAKRTSISKYLTETIPGWGMDELLSFSDALSSCNQTDSGSSKVEMWNHSHTKWQAPSNTSKQFTMSQGPAEVPSIPSIPTSSYGLKSTRGWEPGKLMKPSGLDFFVCYEDSPVVPDIGGITSLSMPFPTSPPSKKQRFGVDF